MTFDRMTRRIACGVAGVGIASVCAVGGVATAAPSAPAHPSAPHSAPAPKTVTPDTKVPDTRCSLAQVERALAKQDPAVWKRINSNPKAKKHFESAVTMTKQQREAKMAEFKKKHPNASSVMNFLKDHNITRPEMKKARDAVQKAKSTCGQY